MVARGLETPLRPPVHAGIEGFKQIPVQQGFLGIGRAPVIAAAAFQEVLLRVLGVGVFLQVIGQGMADGVGEGGLVPPQDGVRQQAVMGRSLAVNLMNHGFTVAGYNRRREPAQALAREYPEKCIACATYQELVSQLNAPRVILMMVPAGAAVDDVIRELAPLLEKGDALIDGGNSFYEDTARRQQELAARGIDFFGTGVSGGEEGALKGPSIMTARVT